MKYRIERVDVPREAQVKWIVEALAHAQSIHGKADKDAAGLSVNPTGPGFVCVECGAKFPRHEPEPS